MMLYLLKLAIKYWFLSVPYVYENDIIMFLLWTELVFKIMNNVTRVEFFFFVNRSAFLYVALTIIGNSEYTMLALYQEG